MLRRNKVYYLQVMCVCMWVTTENRKYAALKRIIININLSFHVDDHYNSTFIDALNYF